MLLEYWRVCEASWNFNFRTLKLEFEIPNFNFKTTSFNSRALKLSVDLRI